jgi:hypothetical protein
MPAYAGRKIDDGTFLGLPLAQPHTGSAAVLVDQTQFSFVLQGIILQPPRLLEPDTLTAPILFNKHDPSSLERSLNCTDCIIGNLSPLPFEVDNCGQT